MPNGAFPLDGFDVWLEEPTVAEALLDCATAGYVRRTRSRARKSTSEVFPRPYVGGYTF